MKSRTHGFYFLFLYFFFPAVPCHLKRSEDQVRSFPYSCQVRQNPDASKKN